MSRASRPGSVPKHRGEKTKPGPKTVMSKMGKGVIILHPILRVAHHIRVVCTTIDRSQRKKKERQKKRKKRSSTHFTGHQVLVSPRGKLLSKEIPDMSQHNQQQITDVRREQDVVRRILFHRVDHGCALRMPRGIPILLVRAVSKFRVYGRKNLFGCRGSRGQREAVRVVCEQAVVIVLAKNGVFGRGCNGG